MSTNKASSPAQEPRTQLPEGSPELEIDKISQVYYTEWNLKEDVNARLKSLIARELNRSGVSETDRARIISEVFSDLSKPVQAPSQLPDKAPALYKERDDKSQSAEEFTRQHYSEFFGKGLTRADLKRLDLPLYRMLMKGSFPTSLADEIPPAQGKGGGGRRPKLELTKEEREQRLREQRREASRRFRARRGG